MTPAEQVLVDTGTDLYRELSKHVDDLTHQVKAASRRQGVDPRTLMKLVIRHREQWKTLVHPNAIDIATILWSWGGTEEGVEWTHAPQVIDLDPYEAALKEVEQWARTTLQPIVNRIFMTAIVSRVDELKAILDARDGSNLSKWDVALFFRSQLRKAFVSHGHWFYHSMDLWKIMHILSPSAPK